MHRLAQDRTNGEWLVIIVRRVSDSRIEPKYCTVPCTYNIVAWDLALCACCSLVTGADEFLPEFGRISISGIYTKESTTVPTSNCGTNRWMLFSKYTKRQYLETSNHANFFCIIGNKEDNDDCVTLSPAYVPPQLLRPFPP
jgi:hypothetical protein